MTTNRTHRARLARALAAVAGVGYQTALARVIAAAQAGTLPDRLDGAGMRQALDILLAPATAAAAGQAGSAVRLQPRYYRLNDVCADRLAPGVPARVARAATLGLPAARNRGSYDPVEILDAVMSGDDDADDPDAHTDWWRRLVDAGARADVALPDPYPPRACPDGSVPIDRALDRRDGTGDVDAYEHDLRAIIRAEPRDVDAHAHLGHLYLSLSDPGGDLVVTPPPDARQRRAWLRTALGHYQTGVGIAELALPDPFTGFLPWAELDNRPFFRALHGMALALWRLGRFDPAEMVLLNMLWLNPICARSVNDLLLNVRAQRRIEGHNVHRPEQRDGSRSAVARQRRAR